jgi:hypothetical protein
MFKQFSSDANKDCYRRDANRDCYRRANEAQRTADAATDPYTKSDFLDFERRWLSLARGFELEHRAQGTGW